MYSALYVQYGCGQCAPKEWVNFDASLRVRVEHMPIFGAAIRVAGASIFPKNVRFGNVVRGLPIPDGTARGVYCSHVLEHLPRDVLPRVFEETKRILVPGGRFRLIVPDLQWRAACYLAATSKGDVKAADHFLDCSLLGRRNDKAGIVSLFRRIYGRSEHLWMYDWNSLRHLLEDAGFGQVRKCEIGDSGDQMFDLVEEESRFFDGGERELAIEALKS